jgi:hypothetical protein
MTKYLYRTYPKCKDYLGVVVRDPPGPKGEIPIDTYWRLHGFNLRWMVVLKGENWSEKQEIKAKDFGVKARRSDGD